MNIDECHAETEEPPSAPEVTERTIFGIKEALAEIDRLNRELLKAKMKLYTSSK